MEANIKEIITYLTNLYGKPNLNINPREQLKFYLTTYTIELPTSLNEKLNRILQTELRQNVDVENIRGPIVVIKEDITQLKCDAIVNAANANGLGCFDYNHKCIDNVIHNKAGPMLRIFCRNTLNGSKLSTSDVMITPGFNLPSKYVIHTVGPIYDKSMEKLQIQQLAMCYINCLDLAVKYNLNSIAFCCISTGIYGFPAKMAKEIAVHTVNTYLNQSRSNLKVVFCTYSEADFKLYSGV